MMRAALLALLLVGGSASADTWLTVPIGSQHFKDRGPTRDWNEFNPGIGLEYGITNTLSVTAVAYKNSYSKPTFAAGLQWFPLKWKVFKFGLTAMVLTGYDYPVAAAPVVAIEYSRVGAHFTAVPNMGDRAGFVGMQIKFRLEKKHEHP